MFELVFQILKPLHAEIPKLAVVEALAGPRQGREYKRARNIAGGGPAANFRWSPQCLLLGEGKVHLYGRNEGAKVT